MVIMHLAKTCGSATKPCQVQRLQNRVLLLQREVQELRGPSERGHLEPTVPEKQFQQLSQAHGKAQQREQKSASDSTNILPSFNFRDQKAADCRSPTTCRHCELSCKPSGPTVGVCVCDHTTGSGPFHT